MNWPPNEERVLLSLKSYRPGQIIPGRTKNQFYRVLERAFWGAYLVKPYNPRWRNSRVV